MTNFTLTAEDIEALAQAAVRSNQVGLHAEVRDATYRVLVDPAGLREWCEHAKEFDNAFDSGFNEALLLAHEADPDGPHDWEKRAHGYPGAALGNP